MGLDNGIILKTKQKIDFEDWEVKPDYIKITFDEFLTKEYGDAYCYDVCYWRKCWDLRNDILDILNDGKESGDGHIDIDKPKQVEEIVDTIIHYLKNPDEWQNSIWSFDEFLPHLAQDIVDLTWLANFMRENDTARVYFYDSY